MAYYRLSKNAREDLIRIHQHGVENYGVYQADKYYNELFLRFEEIAQNPYLYQVVDHIGGGYRRSACGADNVFYRVLDDNVEIVRILGRQDSEQILLEE